MDVDELSEELELQNLAEDNGSANIPNGESVTPDGAEFKIRQYVEGRMGMALNEYEKSIAGINQAIKRANLKDILERLKSLPAELQKQRRAAPPDVSRDYEESLARVAAAERRVEEIQRANGVMRPPDYPESRFLVGAVLAGTVLMEGTVNAVFYQQGSEFGLIGGLMWAFFLALFDVLVVFTVARTAPWAIFGRRWFQVVGVVASSFVGAWVVLYNLYTSHVRERLAEGLEPTVAMNDAFEALAASPLGLSQADSWMLFTLGAFFTVLAAASGWRWDDVVPLLGAADRKLTQVREDHDHYLAAFEEHAGKGRERYLKEVDILLDTARRNLRVIEERVQVKTVAEKALTSTMENWKETGRTLTQLYRDQNLRYRTDGATPPVFKTPPRFRTKAPQASSIEDDRRYLADQRKLLKMIDRKAPIIRKRLSEMVLEDQGSKPVA